MAAKGFLPGSTSHGSSRGSYCRALPRFEMSALSMEREPASGVTHLKGDAEVKMALGPDLLTILRADEITYNPDTGDIETRGQVPICNSGTVGPNGPCL
jgi:Lipopolysaccharide-assembly, LptC-related